MMSILEPIIYAISHLIFLMIGIMLGYYMFTPKEQVSSPNQLKKQFVHKIKPPKAEVVKRPTAQDLRRKNTPEGQADQAVADTFKEYLKL